MARILFRSRERSLILLVLATFGFVCFGAIFFLPGANEVPSSQNKVYRVYHAMRESGADLIMPPPPPAVLDNPNVRHGVIDRPDPHKVDDKARLLAQIEMDQEIQEMRNRQQQKQVLDKPNLHPEKKSSSSSKPVVPPAPVVKDPDDFEDPAAAANVLPFGGGSAVGASGQGSVVVQGGSDGGDAEARVRRDKIKEMMKHAWDGYSNYAWGKNELRPVTKRGHSASIFGSAAMGASIIDGMDTLYLMGMMDEFETGREWIEQNFDMNKMSGDVSVFETNIRYLGGFLSLYALTGDALFREKAKETADKLLPAFNSPTGIPYALVNMRSGVSKNFGWASGGSSILAEFGSLHMEFSYLSDVTGDPVYAQKVERVREVVQSVPRPKGLYPNYMNPKTGKWGQAHTSMGALGDSFYEYLLKEWIRSGKRDMQAKQLFDEAALAVEKQLVKVSRSGLTYFAEYKYGRLEHKMDHLACFAGGMYGLAAREEQDENSERFMNIARGITNTCHEAYIRSDTKLGPESFRFSDSVEARAVKSTERYYILRPETVEAYFYLWRLTKDQKYRDWAWDAAQAIERNCRVEGGYTGVKNVYSADSPKDDVQQSFFLAETLKYLYLIFSDDSLISFDEWVFNTEAHPLPVKGKNSLYREADSKKTGKRAKKKDRLPAAAL